MERKAALYVGRFQPFHVGHLQMVNFALDHVEKLVIGLGSCNAKPSAKNPFSVADREQMIRDSVWCPGRISFVHLNDYPESDSTWAYQVRNMVQREVGDNWKIIGRKKDESSFYLDLFPERELLIPSSKMIPVSATTIREMYFYNGIYHNSLHEVVEKLVPFGTFDFLQKYKKCERYNLACEGAYL